MVRFRTMNERNAKKPNASISNVSLLARKGETIFILISNLFSPSLNLLKEAEILRELKVSDFIGC